MSKLHLVLLGLCLCCVPVTPVIAADKAESDEYYELMKILVDTFEQIDRNFVKEVDRRELMEAAVRGMLLKLDPYSSYIDPEELSGFNEQVEQEFGGIGIQVSVEPKTRALTVMTPIPGTPAYEVGIRAGDTIVEIEGQPAIDFPEGEELNTAIKLLKGPAGETVKMKIKHESDDEPIEVSVTRAIIRVPTVFGDHYQPNGEWDYWVDDESKIGYIRLTHFSRKSAEEVEAALKTLKSQGMRGLVLDLRFNPGGLLTAAVQISDLFVEKGTIVSTKGRNTEEQVWPATAPGTYKDFPMAVLVNRYSASASEIVSACLQDHERAKIIGERTWGKGSVQNVIELEAGLSALKLTTASYHRPSGKNIHRFPKATEEDEWGVYPEEGFMIKMEPKELQEYLEDRRERDIVPSVDADVYQRDFKDRHLIQAVDWLKEQLEPKAETPAPKAGQEEPAVEKKPEAVGNKAGAAVNRPAERRAAA